MTEQSETGTTVIYGPHCHHDECGWAECDLTGEIEFPCQEESTCPYCGPRA